MANDPLVSNQHEYSAEDKELVNKALQVLELKPLHPLEWGLTMKYLDRLNPELAASTAMAITKAISETPGLDKQSERQLRVNFMINAYKQLKNEMEHQSVDESSMTNTK